MRSQPEYYFQSFSAINLNDMDLHSASVSKAQLSWPNITEEQALELSHQSSTPICKAKALGDSTSSKRHSISRTIAVRRKTLDRLDLTQNTYHRDRAQAQDIHRSDLQSEDRDEALSRHGQINTAETLSKLPLLTHTTLAGTPGSVFNCFDVLPGDKIDNTFLTSRIQTAHRLGAGLTGYQSRGRANTSSQQYTWLATHYEHAFYAAICFASTNWRLANQAANKVDTQEVVLHGKALKLVRLAIEDPNMATHESTIRAVLNLSFAPILPALPETGKVPHPQQSIMRTWQNMHLLSGLNFVPEHLQGLQQLVKMKGGLFRIQNNLLRVAICFNGLINATRNLQRPHFPFAAHSNIVATENGLWRSPMIPRSTSNIYSDGFADLDFATIPGEDSLQLSTVLSYLRDFTSIIDDYASGNHFSNSSLLIADQKNYVQHCLLSLPSRAELETNYQSQVQKTSIFDVAGDPKYKFTLYEAARLSAFAYSHLVTNPHNPNTFPRRTLVQQLLAQLAELDLAKNKTEPSSKLLFWSSVVGAILALGLNELRNSFICLISDAADALKITSWSEASETMEEFLWHSDTSDTDALDLWVDVVRYRKVERGKGI